MQGPDADDESVSISRSQENISIARTGVPGRAKFGRAGSLPYRESRARELSQQDLYIYNRAQVPNLDRLQKLSFNVSYFQAPERAFKLLYSNFLALGKAF